MEQSGHKGKMYLRWFLIRLAMVVYDIFAVNVSYFAALLIRFYVASEFNVWAVKYVPAFRSFAPFYTVCCLLLFCLFKLYNNRWKYASLNDMNRILVACLATCVVQVAGSALFVMRMPLSYYGIGAMIQFAMLAVSRFSYRLFIIEWSRIVKQRSGTEVNVMIVGVGETSRMLLKHMERNVDSTSRPVCLVDFRGSEFGNMQGGLPIVSGIDKIPDAVQKYDVGTVILADTIMPEQIRRQVREICREAGVEVQDFFGCFQDFRGAVSLRNLLEYTKGPVELVIGGKRRSFTDGEQAFLSLSGKYLVSSISAKDGSLVIELQTDILVPNDVKEKWVQSYQEETGEEISFF